jgi:tRNA pseudouridine38-40 synthase
MTDAVRNLKLLIEYDGAEFSGWQQQRGLRTVEGELRRALQNLTGRDEVIYGAGRTDAGAHAEGQVANFRYSGPLPPDRVAAALNARLPADVAVLGAEEVPADFHARYSARWRHYRYRYLDRPVRPALARDQCWHVRQRLDVDAMRRAAASLLGEHDWTAFCTASEPAAGRVRTMRSAALERPFRRAGPGRRRVPSRAGQRHRRCPERGGLPPPPPGLGGRGARGKGPQAGPTHRAGPGTDAGRGAVLTGS